jgi:hypothetical protein
MLSGIGLQSGGGLGPDDGQGQRIVKNERPIEKLMRRPPYGHAPCRSAELPFFHGQFEAHSQKPESSASYQGIASAMP